MFFEGDGSSSDEQLDRPRTLFAEPIIWDIQDEEEEYLFVDNYQNFQEEENSVILGVVLGVEEESMPFYDTDIKDIIEEEEGFVEKGGFGGEEDNIEDVVVVVNDLCSSMIQTTLNIDFKEDINTKSHELMSFEKSVIIKDESRHTKETEPGHDNGLSLEYTGHRRVDESESSIREITVEDINNRLRPIIKQP
nr:hypothetical protein [Tanacetum cinerariifolium]